MPFNNFAKFKNNVLIETGSHVGDGIQAALDAGFSSVISIEITDKYYQICKRRFAGNPRVQLVLGDTVDKLYEIMKPLNEPVTLYLDGHWDTGAVDETRGVMDYPILTELEIIAQHPIKTHTILIDDVRLFNTPWELGHDAIVKKVMDINENYIITYEDGLAGRVGDVLVAVAK